MDLNLFGILRPVGRDFLLDGRFGRDQAAKRSILGRLTLPA
jgi:hypothetical protein